jgi:hypothetical protein
MTLLSYCGNALVDERAFTNRLDAPEIYLHFPSTSPGYILIIDTPIATPSNPSPCLSITVLPLVNIDTLHAVSTVSHSIMSNTMIASQPGIHIILASYPKNDLGNRQLVDPLIAYNNFPPPMKHSPTNQTGPAPARITV